MAATRASDEEDSTRSFIFSIISSFRDYLGLQFQCFNFHVMKDHSFARTTAFVMSQYSPGGAWRRLETARGRGQSVFSLLVDSVGNAYFIMKSCSFVDRFMMIATVDIREKL